VGSGGVVTALLHSESGAGAGAYNSFDRWSTSLRGDAGSEGAKLVTVHEALHAALNDTTAFGVLLAACAALEQAGGGAPEGVLKRLVGQCRGVHEAFATFESLWLVADGDVSYLSGYPRYQRWYKDASDLVPLPDHMRRKEMMLEAAARACMQGPVLARITSGGPLSGQAWVCPASERPDERFGLLRQFAEGEFWDRAWDQCAEAVSGSPLLAAIEASDADPSLRAQTYGDAFDEPLAICAHLLYAAVAALLAEHGALTLDYDGHQDFLAGVIAAVEREAPAARGLLLASSDERGVAEETFEMWGRERLVLRERPRPAVVRQFADVLRDRQVAALLSGSGERMHVFASVRPASRLRQQFAVDAPGSAWLGDRGSSSVVTVRSAAEDSDSVDLTVLDEPGQLSRLVRALPKPLTVHVSISLACLGDLAWRDRWSRALRRTRVTGLVDLSPMAQLSAWRTERSRLRYAQATVRDVGGSPAELLVWQVGDTGLPLLLVCTSVTSDILRQYIERTYPDALADTGIITGRQDEIELATSHLVGEEYFFDLAAYPEPAVTDPGVQR
jgi:hypothetical protein